jgi:hypothetical protein
VLVVVLALGRRLLGGRHAQGIAKPKAEEDPRQATARVKLGE